MTYTVKIHKRALKFIQSIPEKDNTRIKSRIKESL